MTYAPHRAPIETANSALCTIETIEMQRHQTLLYIIYIQAILVPFSFVQNRARSIFGKLIQSLIVVLWGIT